MDPLVRLQVSKQNTRNKNTKAENLNNRGEMRVEKHVDAVEEQTMDFHTKKEEKIVPPSQKIAMLVEKEDTSVSAASVKIKDL